MNQAASPATSARSTVELCQPADSTVRASCSQHSVVFFSRGLCKARSNVEHLIYRRAVSVSPYAGDRLLIKALNLYASGVLNPALELAGTFGVVEARKLFRLFKQSSFDNAVDLNGVLSKTEVNANAAVIDMLVMNPKRLFLFINRKAGELLSDCALCFNVLPVILYIEVPAVRVMLREIAGPIAVRLRRLTRNREVPNKRSASLRLLLVLRKADDLTNSFQAARQAKLSRHNSGAAPLLGRCYAAHKRAQTSPFKRRIECCLQDFGVIQSVLELLGQALALGEVDYLNRTVVPSVTE